MLCCNTSKFPVELNAHLVPTMQHTCLLKGWMGLKQVSDFKNCFVAMWFLMKATSIAVKMFACCWTLLYSVELKVLIYFLRRIVGASTKWRLPRCKHRHMEAGKLGSVPAFVLRF